MSQLFQLQCPQCRRYFGNGPLTICEECFSPLEMSYDLSSIGRLIDRATIESRPHNIWRYAELLPVAPEHRSGLPVGFTPLLEAPTLAGRLGIDGLYLKNDSVCFPTLSFKDRVVAVALAQAKAFGFEVVGCASTGNLANSVAAQAARLGLEAWIFVPSDLEPAKLLATAVYGAHLVRVDGTYDQVNRLCAEIAETRHWGLVNVNLRNYYAEGSKTVAYEIAEQLGWKLPDNVVVPMAGGAQITRIAKGFSELVELGLVPESPVRIFGAQAAGCSPITTAAQQGVLEIVPQQPATICHSLAIGNPADGYRALQVIAASHGFAEDATDQEIIRGIRVLAETEGIFGETAAGVTVAAAGKLIRDGRIKSGETTVLCITGNGLKTTDALVADLPLGPAVAPKLAAFEASLERLAVPA
ncbi:MAG TPA: threonine synthase [Candidatus Nanopelagicaceae bacterium]|nr:threonine synthase [Candidatus Nanopelagicaceae bacterium]